MFRRKVTILENKKIAPSYFLMYLESFELALNSSPGQFLHLKCSSDHNLLLRRPLSIHRVIYQEREPVAIALLYKVRGKGTSYLSKREKGEIIDCIGPLGKGFEIGNTQKSIIVAGGIGIAPLFFLIEKIGIKNSKPKIVAFVGAKTKNEILCTEELKNLGIEVHIATEDGSSRYKGLVGELFKSHLISHNLQLTTTVYACGPKEMLKEIALFSNKHRVSCQVSFEQFMGCGIGICNACVIRTNQGYRRVCKDGPVFRAEEIDWERI